MTERPPLLTCRRGHTYPAHAGYCERCSRLMLADYQRRREEEWERIRRAAPELPVIGVALTYLLVAFGAATVMAQLWMSFRP